MCPFGVVNYINNEKFRGLPRKTRAHGKKMKTRTLENFEKKEFSQNRFTSVRKLRLFQSLLDNFANKR